MEEHKKYPHLDFDKEEENSKVTYRSMAQARPAPIPLRSEIEVGGKPPATTTTATTVLVDKTNYASTNPRELPPPPFRLEVRTHFFVQGSVSRIAAILGAALKQHSADFEFNSTKCKWKVQYAKDGQLLHFNILMFKDGSKYVVEFQRRSGDLLPFLRLYQDMVQCCQRHQIVTELTTNHSANQPMPPLSTSTPKNMAEVLAPVAAMLQSVYVDLQQQGLLAVHSLSRNEDCQLGLSVLIPELLKLLSSQDVDVQSLALMDVVQLSSNATCVAKIMEGTSWQVLFRLASNSDHAPNLRRNSLVLLTTLCRDYGSLVEAAPDAHLVVEMLRNADQLEEHMRVHAIQAREALVALGVYNA